MLVHVLPGPRPDVVEFVADANRDELRKLAEDGEHDGAIAPDWSPIVEGSAAGWVSLAPREDYERLAFSTMLRLIDDRPVWSIVCFVVGRHHRARASQRRS